ncbi:WD domain, G-beta repeat protein [Dictyocaulus viviparus]|uniref:WD repeat domain-containing protein 83 n=1 Tax=Dictyocaulus viviparus TaxID=29172 RepID=A0A0D8XDL7_DICVI|nr:WD domain, G-beta repeat protein [Dictyocaulus viviparus]
MVVGPPTQRARIIDCRQDAVRAVRYNGKSNNGNFVVDGNYCLTSGSDKSVKLWNPIKGTLLKTYTGTGNEVFDVASSSDNAQVAAGGADKCLTIFDVETGKILRRWRAHAARVNAVAFNEESNVAFSGSMDCTMKAFDNRSRSDKPIQVFNEATDSLLSIDINGGEIVTGSADGNYRLYDIREGKLHIDFMGESVNCVHFTPDANCVLASVQDGNVRLMDKVTGKMLARYWGHKNSEYKVDSCVLASIEEIASGSEDGFVYIWSLLDSNMVAKLEHTSKIVHSLSSHPKKKHLLTAAGQLVYLWVPKNDQDFEC